MKTQSYLSVILISLISFFFFSSCIREDTTHENSAKPSDVINIGEAHNAGLTLMLSKLQKLPKTRSGTLAISKKRYEQLTLETAKEVVASYDIQGKQKAEVYAYMDKLLVEKSYNNDELIYIGMTPLQETLAKELDNILMDDDDDLSSLNRRIAAVEAKAKALLSGEALETVLSACYVSSYTLQYWHDNATEWQKLAPRPITRGIFSWKKLGRADLKGALAAGGGGLATTLIGAGPVGWKAWAALVIGGAVVGSLDNAYDQLWPAE